MASGDASPLDSQELGLMPSCWPWGWCSGYQLSGYQLSGYQLSGYQLSGYQLKLEQQRIGHLD